MNFFSFHLELFQVSADHMETASHSKLSDIWRGSELYSFMARKFFHQKCNLLENLSFQ